MDTWLIVVGINTFVLYASTLLAVGTALFMLTLGAAAGTATARLGKAAALLAALAFALAVGLGGGNMLGGGPEVLLSHATWRMAVHTTLGDSATLGIVGMLCLIQGFRPAANHPPIFLTIGVLLGIGGFLVTGHAATAAPAWLMVPVIAVHLAAAAFWLGSLFPLFVAARTTSATEAGIVVTRFSRLAVIAVAALIISGAITTFIQVGSVDAFFSTAYGNRLFRKLVGFAVLLALAAFNKFVLTPRLRRGDISAAKGLRRSIAVEGFLYLLILVAAASLTTVEPPQSAGEGVQVSAGAE